MTRIELLSMIKIPILFSLVVSFIFLPVNTVYGHGVENEDEESLIVS